MDLELKGKTAIITGGSRGIGKAVGREFGLEGMNVVLVARGQEALEETARKLAEETGASFITIVADTGDPESVKAMVKEAAEKLGRIDVLVNSAARVGGAYTPKLSEITEEDFWGDMNVKVMGYLRCAQAVAPYMIDQGWGRIINISGMASRNSSKPTVLRGRSSASQSRGCNCPNWASTTFGPWRSTPERPGW